MDPSLVRISGVTTGLVGASVTAWVRFPGERAYAVRLPVVTVSATGRFVWEHRTNRRMYVYFRSGTVQSARIIIASR